MNNITAHLVLIGVGAVSAALFLGAASAPADPGLDQPVCPSCVGFDPQPDPPNYRGHIRLPSIKGFDPQPDPPAPSVDLRRP